MHRSSLTHRKCKANARTRRQAGLRPDGLLLQPWFLGTRIASAIQALVPDRYWRKMRNFFEDYGCMICGSEQNYGSNGMCRYCYNDVVMKLGRSARRRMKSKAEQRFDLSILRQSRLAKKLLGRFSLKHRAASERRRLDKVPVRNPVYEALSPLPRFPG